MKGCLAIVCCVLAAETEVFAEPKPFFIGSYDDFYKKDNNEEMEKVNGFLEGGSDYWKDTKPNQMGHAEALQRRFSQAKSGIKAPGVDVAQASHLQAMYQTFQTDMWNHRVVHTIWTKNRYRNTKGPQGVWMPEPTYHQSEMTAIWVKKSPAAVVEMAKHDEEFMSQLDQAKKEGASQPEGGDYTLHGGSGSLVETEGTPVYKGGKKNKPSKYGASQSASLAQTAEEDEEEPSPYGTPGYRWDRYLDVMKQGQMDQDGYSVICIGITIFCFLACCSICQPGQEGNLVLLKSGTRSTMSGRSAYS